MQQKLNQKYEVPFNFIDYFKVFAEKSEAIYDGNKVVKALENVLFPMNIIFALESGDIGYFAGGLFPKRKHNVV